MSEMGLHHLFGHLKHKLWPKEGPGVRLTIWFPTIKSQESPQFPCVQVACDIPLKSFQWGLQLFFRPHLNQRSTHKVMGPQSCESPNFGNFETLQTKCHLNVGFVERHRVYYKGEGDGFPQVWAMVYPWLVLAPKVFQLCANQLVVWFVLVCVSDWSASQSSSFHLEVLARPFTLEVLRARDRAPTSYSSAVFILDSNLNFLKRLRLHHLERNYKAYKFVMYEMQKRTRCIIHNGHAINLISTNDIYDKLVIAKGKNLKIYFNIHHVVKKNCDFFFIF